MAIIPWRQKRDVWNPWHELDHLQQEMNHLFDLSFGRGPECRVGLLEQAWGPSVDIADSPEAIVVKAELPGMKKEDIDVSIYHDTLVIKGEKKETRDAKEKNYLRNERFYGSFRRAIPLHADIDESKITAAYKEGVLELVLPKKETEKPKQLKIDIK